jgi:hypothetical protein
MESPFNRFWLMTPAGRKNAVGGAPVNYPLAESGFFVPTSSDYSVFKVMPA